MTHTKRLIGFARKRGVFRSKDLEDQGIPRQTLARLHRRGIVVRIGRGLYRLPEGDITEHHALVEIANRIPQGVICLLSALQFHDLTTQDSFDIWVAIENKAWRPEGNGVSLQIVYMSGPAFTEGIETHLIEGVEVRVYGAAKTVADCFKHRNRIGLDVALEALRDYRNSDAFNADALWHFAGICRIRTVIRPYLEAMA